MTMQFFMGESKKPERKIKKVHIFIKNKKITDQPVEVDFTMGEYVARTRLAEKYGLKDFTQVLLKEV